MSLHLYGQNLVNICEVIGTSVFTFIILGLFSFIYCTYANLVNVIALVDVINELRPIAQIAGWNVPLSLMYTSDLSDSNV